MTEEDEMNELTETSDSILPELTDEDKDRAESEDSLEWACGLMEFYYNGNLHRAKDLGLTFQVIKDPETGSQGIRVLVAFDEELCLKFLAMLKHTFEYAGFTVQIEPYLVLCKMSPKPDSSPSFFEAEPADEGEVVEEPDMARPRNKGTAAQIGMEVV